MQSVRFVGVGRPAQIAEIPKPSPGPGQVLIKIGGAGVCHSDLHGMEEALGFKPVETIVHGVNTPEGNTTIISCASCTTNCITPVMEILGRRIGVAKAAGTTTNGDIRVSWSARPRESAAR